MEALQEKDLASRLPPRLSLITMLGGTIAVVYSRCRSQRNYEFAMDKVYIKIDGRLVYLWRAVDAEGEVLDVLVQSQRDKRAALKLMRKL
jgi:putative transposase